MTTGSTPSVSTLRRRAAKQGIGLVKISETSRWYHQYGPFMLTENGVARLYGMDLESVASELLP